jgi:hypothetical protein
MATPPPPTPTPTPTLFQLHYRKHKYTPEKIDSALLYDIQNYIPIYRRFFDINETNYNNIQLNQHYYLQNIIEHQSRIMETEKRGEAEANDETRNSSLNHLETVIGDDSGNTINVPMFVKYSPLLDPIRYLSGKYEPTLAAKSSLPKYDSTPDTCEEKMLNTNNSSYVDGFFSYLTSCALHTHGIVHGLDYYGSYLCKQREFSTNVFDDIDYLADCSFFNTYENERFTIDYSQFGDDETSMTNSGNNKWMKLRNKLNPVLHKGNNAPIKITEDDIEITVADTDTATATAPLSAEEVVPVLSTSLDIVEINMDDFDTHQTDIDIRNCNKTPRNNDRNSDSDSDSETSQSNSSYTTMESDSGDDDIDSDVDNTSKEDAGNNRHDDSDRDGSDSDGGNDGSNSDSNSDSDGSDSNSDSDGGSDRDESGSGSEYSDYSDDEQIIVKIKDFPIQAILLEKCVSTLDSIMMHDELTKEEWTSLLFQVIMTLVIYQKMFAFTHNDLHTNNIMFIETTEEFIYYLFEGQYYKVPTYGRIFKIIDFGRAIYKFRGELICSDSFHPKGDAATQYNFPPFYNPDKPTVEPNFSFDLCRLACALFDYFVYDLRKVEKLCKTDPIIKLVVKWTMDDKGRNVLYKSSGEERYPDFKLYKMISRSVHGHIPANEIHTPIFDEYKITYKKYKKHAALAAKFLNQGKNTHLFINVDTLPNYSGEETSLDTLECRSSR